MSPRGAVYSAVSVDPTLPFIQPHTDHRRTTRSEPPFYVPVTASSDARGRLFRTGSNAPCHTSGTRHSSMFRCPDQEWLSQHAAADREPDSAGLTVSFNDTVTEENDDLPRRALQIGILIKMRFRQPVADHSPAGRSSWNHYIHNKESILHHRRLRTELFGLVSIFASSVRTCPEYLLRTPHAVQELSCPFFLLISMNNLDEWKDVSSYLCDRR